VRPNRQTYLIQSIPSPASAGVSVPHRGMTLSMHEPSSDKGYVGGLGFIDVIAGLGASIIGGIFGSKSEKRQIQAQRDVANQQMAAQLEIARLQSASQDRSIDAAVASARIQAENELAAINASYNAQLTGQRLQKAVAEEQLSAQLLAQTQSGIFSLANQGLIQAGNVSTAYPRAGVTGQAIIIGTTVVALAWAFRPKGPARRRKRRFGKGQGANRWSMEQNESPVGYGGMDS
jgi:hypothetical protein